MHHEESEIPAGLEGLSSSDARRRLAQAGPNRWVKRDRLARVREVLGLLLDPMAVMLVVAAAVYFLLGETRDAVVLALALIPVLGVDVAARGPLPSRARQAGPRRRARSPTWSATATSCRCRSRRSCRATCWCCVKGTSSRPTAWSGGPRTSAIDESSLTGESEPQSKREWPSEPGEAPPDARFFAGSQVLSGHGFGLRHHDRGGDAVRRHRGARGADGSLSQPAAAAGGRAGPPPRHRRRDRGRGALRAEPRTR